MKFIVAVLLLSSVVLAEYPTALEISADYKKVYDFYNLEATKFVDKLASVLDARVLTYITAHQKLITHFANVRLIPGVLLDVKSEEIMAKINGRITELTTAYPKVLDRNIFSNELKKHLDILKNGPLQQAEGSIKDLGNYVTKNPNVGKCWQDNRDQIFEIVENGFKAARDAALTTVTNANSTLNTNEVLIDALMTADKTFMDICKSSGTAQVNACIGSYMTVTGITFPVSSSIWESTTSTAVSLNLQIAESMIQTATQIAVIQITQVVYQIENCVKGVLAQNKA